MSRFGLEVAAHIGALRRYARALLRDRSDADDLVQETLTRALTKADQFQTGTNLRAWLFTILHNLHVNLTRQRAARPAESPLDEAMPQLVIAPEQESRVALQEMAAALATLSVEQRQVLLLISLEGLKYDEAAQALGVPTGTIMSRLSRAREALRLALAKAPTASSRQRDGKGPPATREPARRSRRRDGGKEGV